MYYEFQIGNLFLILGVIAVCKWLSDKMLTLQITPAKVDLTIASVLFGMLLFLHAEVVTFKSFHVGAFSFDWTFLNMQIILFIYLAVTVSSRIGMAFLTGTLILFYWERGFFHYWQAWLTFCVVLGISLAMCHYAAAVLRHFWRSYLVSVLLCFTIWATTALTITRDSVGDWVINFGLFSLQFIIVNAFNIRLQRDYNREMMLTKQANYDELTGLKNFRAFRADLNQRYTDFRQRNSRFVLVTMDIDHFKVVNDTYGHLIGNDVLRQTAEVLRQVVQLEPACNGAYRTGGEEFSLLLTQRDDIWLQNLCRHLQDLIRQQRCQTAQGTVRWTMSLGCDVILAGDSGYMEVYRRADKSLYASKENGRDQTTICGTRLAVHA